MLSLLESYHTGTGGSIVSSSAIPLPVSYLGHILAVGGDILAVLHQLVFHLLDQVGGAVAQLGQTLNCVHNQVEAVDVVAYPHVEGVVMVPSSL